MDSNRSRLNINVALPPEVRLIFVILIYHVQRGSFYHYETMNEK